MTTTCLHVVTLIIIFLQCGLHHIANVVEASLMSESLLSWIFLTQWSSCISSSVFTKPLAVLNRFMLPSFTLLMMST